MKVANSNQLSEEALTASMSAPQGVDGGEAVAGRRHERRCRAGNDVSSWQAGQSRKVECIRGSVQHEHRVESSDASGAAKLLVAVESGLVKTLCFERRDPFPTRS